MDVKEIINEWLEQHGRGAASRLSEKSGLSRSYISDLSSGKCGAKLPVPTARALEAGTGISHLVWLGLEQPKRERKRAGAA